MKRTIIAAAVLSTIAVGSAYAEGCTAGCDPAELFTATNVFTDIGEFGFITLHGKVNVSSSSGATVNNTQNVDISGVNMKTPPQSYVSGKVTTTINTTDAWDHESGSGSGWGVSQSYSDHAWAYNKSNTQTRTASSSAAFIAGGGFATGFESSYRGYNYVNTHASANGFLAAGFIAGLGGGPGVIFGGVAAGFAAALNTHESVNFGGGLEAQAAGYGVAYGGYAAAGQSTATETHSGYGEKVSASYSEHSHAYGWTHNFDENSGSVTVTGTVTQHINTQTPTTMSAGIGDNALSTASGNIGVNIASGVDNAQSNDAALSNMDVGPVFGTAQIYSTQSSSGNAKVGDFNFVASVGAGALANATGNIGVNVASGVGNVQNNSLAASATTDSSSGMGGWDHRHGGSQGGEVIATDQNCQTADAGVNGQFTGSSMLGMGALANATGNIGVNIASGVGNLQHNGLAVASVSHQ
ncbi:cell wall anchor protein [Paraburkholderia elongata]|uniref:Cell wall anchor protein n=1 Tax=Paraburkholderia elongata TaxID=2675747 RepID=A0A972SMB0_9BURK|nr:cell wall anchor protein [Paraburkholderia elongata]NPT56475.1 cell wall anchor protein [Paraburkholderia elongata]